MKIVHLSDLHIGRRLSDISLLEDQEHILKQILAIIAEERPQAVIIAGDVYDKPVPTAEAIRVLDDFIVALSNTGVDTFIISGNHDSPERLSFGNRIFSAKGVHIAPVYNGTTQVRTLSDEHGKVNFYLLPFIRPAAVRRYFGDDLPDYNAAVRAAVSAMDVDTSERNVIITHQFVTGSVCDSEELSVGSTENVDGCIFDDFDYVALGHIHRPQNIGDKRLRYCGTPLKYSLSELGQNKSVTVVELGKKGDLELRYIPLKPLHEMIELRGTFEELTDITYYKKVNREDYVIATLTNERDVPDAVKQLQKVYPRLLKMRYDNTRTQTPSVVTSDIANESLPPIVIFENFYRSQNNHEITAEQREFLEEAIRKVWGEVQK